MIQSELNDLKKMNSQILTNINSFLRKRLIESLGALLIFIGIILLAIIISYSPDDPNFIYTPENVEINNIGGFYGSVISDFFLQSLGLISILFVINLLSWGLSLINEKIINNFTTKIFFTFVYLIFGTTVLNIFYNSSFWLIDNGNGGFVGRTIKENIYYFTPLIENQYVIFALILLTIISFILSLSLKLNGILMILLFPLTVVKKNLYFLKKKNTNVNLNISDNYTEFKSSVETDTKQKQPFLPFSSNKEMKYKKVDNNFKLPVLNFLEKNSDLKNRKNINDAELTKNSEFLE